MVSVAEAAAAILRFLRSMLTDGLGAFQTIFARFGEC